jgi:hypothetical protein
MNNKTLFEDNCVLVLDPETKDIKSPERANNRISFDCHIGHSKS